MRETTAVGMIGIPVRDERATIPNAFRRHRTDALRGNAAVPEGLELTQGQKDELDRRLAEFEADPDPGATLEEVFARTKHAYREAKESYEWN